MGKIVKKNKINKKSVSKVRFHGGVQNEDKLLSLQLPANVKVVIFLTMFK